MVGLPAKGKVFNLINRLTQHVKLVDILIG